MNLASWIILGILVVIVGLVVRNLFFKKRIDPCAGCTACNEAEANKASCPACAGFEENLKDL